MLLSSDLSNELHLPKLTRIQLTDTNRLLLLLALHPAHNRSNQDERSRLNPSVGAGGSLQAFVYDSASELWMRVADSRFVLSDFYSTLPSLSKAKKFTIGELSKLDDSVRLGATSSSLKTSRRGHAVARGHADRTYQNAGESASDMATRSHCEDRMACAVALNSESDFEYWLSLYARTLAMSGNETSLRVLVDILAGKALGNTAQTEITQSPCWWLSEAPSVLSLDRLKLIKTIVIPEMSKNRALQRITNEIALEVNSS
jgi:protein HIRA/HIR1